MLRLLCITLIATAIGLSNSCLHRQKEQQLSTRDWRFENCNLRWVNISVKTQTRCYNESQSRSPSVLTDCPGAERSGALCYPPCKTGYSGVGPVCWQSCPSGYTDDGAFCRKDVKIIGSNNDACPWYDKCGLTFAQGCSKCPDGYHNDGCTCRIDADIFAKDTYTRGAGTPMSCPPGKERIGALCYGPCPSGYHTSGLYCIANEQKCEQVPVSEPPTSLRPFCFKLQNSASPVTPCFGTLVYADDEDNAKALAECQNMPYKASTISCETFNEGKACQ